MATKRVLAGMRPSNSLHIGNYYGGGQGMVKLQDDKDYDTLYMVADLHATTTPYDPEELKTASRNVVLDYLAFGLDPEKSTIFIQSHVPQHTELAFLLSTSTTIAKMQHLPTYKEKVKNFPSHNTMALLNYPVLMAADILLYKAHKVPVGIDQEPHLEVSRDIAKKFNLTYDTNFPLPTRFKTKGEYIPSLTGEGKMSKSVEGSYINLTDSLEEIEKKLAGAPTDSGKGDKVPQKGGVANLLALVEHFQGEDKRKEYEGQYKSAGIKYSQLKNDLAKAIHEDLKPIQARRAKLESNPDYIEKVLFEGAQKAQKIAQKTVDEVKLKMGLV